MQQEIKWRTAANKETATTENQFILQTKDCKYGPKASIEPLYDGYIYNELAANPETVVENQQSVVTLHTICGVISFQVGFVRTSCLLESNLKRN